MRNVVKIKSATGLENGMDYGGIGALNGTRGGGGAPGVGGLGGIGGPLWRPNGGGRGGAAP